MKKVIKTFVRNLRDMDKVLFIISLVLFIFGALNIVNASSRETVVNSNVGLFHFFFKHAAILIGGFIVFIFSINIPTKKYNKILPIAFIAVLFANAWLVLRGVAHRGASNWINIGPITLQPSEFAKPILILFVSFLFKKYYKKLQDNKINHDTYIWIIIVLSLVFPMLVFLQKDLGTATILFTIFAVLYVFGPISKQEKVKYTLICGAAGIIFALGTMVAAGHLLSNTQVSRLNNFFDPCSKYETTGYQVCNAFIAINNGGLRGVGIGKSTQKYSYIPEPHTDMVFAIIAEEYGVIICSVIFIFYIIILYRILNLSMKTKDLKGKYICLGAATYIFMHIFINLGGLFGIIPLTGVPLPFLSYGGSFTLSLIVMLTIIQRIHIEYKNEKIKIK